VPREDLLSPETVGAYLRRRSLIPKGTPVEAKALGGGVSNVVLDVHAGGTSCVVKQSLPRLRVADEWFAKRERAIIEAEAIRAAARLIPDVLPPLLDLDREACALTIARAPAGWRSWKEELLDGRVREATAARVGEVLAVWHAGTFRDPGAERLFADREVFEQLRIEPYHRTVMRCHPELAGAIGRYVDRLTGAGVCLVHGDYSPKNVLVGDGGLWVIDFEVAHFGNPDFDLAFMLNHLYLKAIHRPAWAGDYLTCAGAFWTAYGRGVPAELAPKAMAVLGQLGCLMVARRVPLGGRAPACPCARHGAPARPAGVAGRSRGDRPGGCLGRRLRLPPRVEAVHAREVLDSRGRPTVEADVVLSDGTLGRANVPSGASTGRHEAHELRDRDGRRYGGHGVRAAVAGIEEEIAPSLAGRDPFDQAGLDRHLVELDGTSDKSRLGANALLAVSLATARAAAASLSVPLWRYLSGDGGGVLPLPMVNVLSGGLHARGRLAFQDFLVVPVGAVHYAEALETVFAVRAATEDLLRDRGLSTLKADEGGFGPALERSEAALDLLGAAVRRAGYRPGEDVAFAVDVAATHFFAAGRYRLGHEGGVLFAEELVERLARLVERYPIVSIEDGLAEDDWEGWSALSERLGDRVQLLGDDLFTTDVERLERGSPPASRTPCSSR
jgi:enolase